MGESRIDLILNNPAYFAYLRQNAQREQKRRFCKHDWQHMRDVARIAYILALEENLPLGKDVIYAAGLLHDIGRWKEYDTGEDHAVVGALLAQQFLDAAGYSAAEAKVITTAIREHRRGGSSASRLGQLLCRADDLARPCIDCEAREECYKIKHMATAKHVLIY